MTAEQALREALRLLPGGSVLDLGAGSGEHARRFAEAGHAVTASDLRPSPGLAGVRWVRGDFLDVDLPAADIVWCAHVLEHLPDVGRALAKMRAAIRAGGILVVTVPPLKSAIVGGHVNLFNLGLLAYRLVLAGFDCSRSARLWRYGYNLSAVAYRDEAVPEGALAALVHDNGDIERLAPYFPPSWNVRQGFNGDRNE